jgi:hypothetical protein
MLAVNPCYVGVLCSDCGHVSYLPPYQADDLTTLPEKYWSLLSDCLCDECWLSRYL